jgi:hypothetical protein
MSRRTYSEPHHHTAPSAVVDERGARDLRPGENACLCRDCVRCCTYITVEIDSPRAAWEYDQWIWALHHHSVQLYVEKPERWFLHFGVACRQLDAAGRCSIHGRHPVLCREYDPRSCERRLPLADTRAWFDRAEQFEEWIRAHRPGHWQRLIAYRRGAREDPPVADDNGRPVRAPALVASGGPNPRTPA